jgi:L-2-hydroxyglutarate oxidase LhgO
LIERQTESRKKRALQLELAKIDMEIKRKEFEYNQRLELAHIEMENEVVAARDNTELAELEARIAEQEVSELTKHKEKDKESNRTCSSPLISSSSYQERHSAHPATADHIPPIG